MQSAKKVKQPLKTPLNLKIPNILSMYWTENMQQIYWIPPR